MLSIMNSGNSTRTYLYADVVKEVRNGNNNDNNVYTT